MATVSNTPRPGYVWDSTDNVWYPIGTGPHTHADYITSGSAINPTIVDAKGDIIAATAADTVGRLAVGSNDQVLTADSSTATGLKWATPSAGGMTLISETTASALSSLSFSSLGSYKQLLLEWQGIYHSNATTRFDLRFNSDSGSNYYGNNVTVLEGTITYRNAPADTAATYYGAFGEGTNNNTGAYAFNSKGMLLLDNYTSTTKFKKYKIMHFHYNNTTTFYEQQLYSDRYWISTSAITSIDVVRTSGTGTFSNVTNTSIRLYGIS